MSSAPERPAPILATLRRSLALRLSVWFALVFAAGGAALFGGLYWFLTRTVGERERQVLVTKLQRYAGVYERDGLPGVQRAVERDTAMPEQRSLLVQILVGGRTLTFGRVPEDWVELRTEQVPLPGGRFSLEREVQVIRVPRDAERDFLFVHAEMRDGAVLRVVRGTDNREVLLQPLRRGFWIAGGALVLVAFGGGAVFAFRATQPLRQVVTTARDIISTGRLDKRVTPPRADDELAELVRLFNRVLERNDALLRAMRESLDNAAHDLRTPLTRLRGTAELALHPNADLSQAREALADCVEESERVLNILNVLMDVTEAESGMMRLRREPSDLVQLLREVGELYEFVAEERGIRLQFQLPDRCEADVDPHRLRQVFANLVDNALKYTPAGGMVRVTAERRNGEAVVRVRDNGQGIPAEEQSKIWTRLYRGDKSRSQRGLGLGLSLVKAVVEAHGGQVGVSSEPGVGSEFSVILPVSPGPQLSAPRVPLAIPAETRGEAAPAP